MTGKRLVLTSCGSKSEAWKIARALVERRLVACVNVLGPIQSVYRWKGRVETAKEYLLLIKTTSAASKRVQKTIQELHSYELPEYIELPIGGGSHPYLRWIRDAVK